MQKTNDLYEDCVAAGLETDNHESDLYIKESPKARELLKFGGMIVQSASLVQLTELFGLTSLSCTLPGGRNVKQVEFSPPSLERNR